MDGLTLGRFQGMHTKHLIHSWRELLAAIELWFGPSQLDYPQAALFKLAQTSQCLITRQI